jgi:archaellum component FlaC
MKDIIVKIMVEVLSILGIVTKEVGQGRTSMPFPVDMSPIIDLYAVTYLKKLIGRKDVEDALQRLDQLTQEEARMAAAEVLTVTRAIDDKVKAVDDKVTDVRNKVKDVDIKVEGVDERVQGVDIKVAVIDTQVRSIDTKVQNVEVEVGAVIQGESYLLQSPLDYVIRLCPHQV